METEDKIFFLPGDLVTVKHNLPNKPIMLITDKASLTFKESKDKTLLGMKCRWFTKDGILQEAIWNTKDIIKI